MMGGLVRHAFRGSRPCRAYVRLLEGLQEFGVNLLTKTREFDAGFIVVLTHSLWELHYRSNHTAARLQRSPVG